MADGRFDIFTERFYKRSLTEFSRPMVRIIDARGEKEREHMEGKTLRSLLIIFVLFSSLFVLPNASGEPMTTSVSEQQRSNDTDRVSSSLQETITQAAPGAILHLPAGTYTEVLTINKPLQIIGDDVTRTIVSPTSPTNGYAIQIIAEGVILSNLEIMNQGEGLYTTGVKISVSNTTIKDCSFHDTPIGIAIWSARNTISNCVFQGCDDEGIVLLGTSTLACTDNDIISCLFSENCDGIELQYAANNQIDSCSFIRNTHAGIDAIESGNDYNIISGCTFTDNEAFGLYLARSSQNLITRCSFSDDALTLVQSAQNTVEKSQIKNIHLQDDSSLILDQCINATTENIVSEQSSFEIRTKHSDQPLLEEKTYTARYHSILIYILSHLKTHKTFYGQLSQARM
jgi:parallel beta-helix repeat protein